MTQHHTPISFPHEAQRGTLRPAVTPNAPPPKKNAVLRVRVDDELMSRLTALSRREFLELNAYVRQALSKHVAAADPQREPDR